MNTTIKCKYCGKEIEISEALQHKIREEARKQGAEESNEKFSKELKDKEEQIEALTLRSQKAEAEELKIRKEKRQLDQDREKFAIEKERQLDEERAKIIKKTTQDIEEKDRLKIAEYEKKLKDMSEDLKKAQTKSEQGSQQLQGEVLELDLEKALTAAYGDDEIIPVAKGTKGGDIIHKVRGTSGRVAGLILWETKRAQWSSSWLAKLREDARKEDATIAVLVSTKLPADVDNFKLEKGVIICQYHYALPLAGVLRRSILQIAVAKQTAESKDENLEMLYQYLQSEAFRHRFEAFAEGAVQMQEDLEAEKRSFERIWKRRGTQIQKNLINISRMYGELQGTMGDALPDIKILSLPGKDEAKE